MQCFIPLADLKGSERPLLFTNPFDYEAHPFCIQAKMLLEKHLPQPEEMKKGKMFGILVAQNARGEIGYLSAYSGNEQYRCEGVRFVPQVFDITQPDGFFRKEEEQLNKLNDEIEQLERSPLYNNLKQQLERHIQSSAQQLQHTKTAIKKAKEERAKTRMGTNDKLLLDSLIKESQTEKSNFTKLKKRLKKEQLEIECALAEKQEEIAKLKRFRKKQSARVQKELFDRYLFHNFLGQHQSASQLFAETDAKVPPAGTGDCAAPKLLQYAINHQLTPLAMVEFWWGPSPQKAIRKHNYFYPACKSKCEPILNFMLQGLNIETSNGQTNLSLSVIFEDEHLAVINKPAGLLSVPGKDQGESVQIQAQQLFPTAGGPLIVHRLDMATSGLMLIAKSKKVHEHLQKQFLTHTIKKVYIALLDGIVEKDKGEINLPLRVDIDDRPRQVVCFDHGKSGLTYWEVINRENGRTRVKFYPVTGRTHQLRVHAAHQLGLNTPIVGDPLYGQKSARLMLHAESITFIHPATLEKLSFTAKADF
ncbi:pseudouridine synthase [Carboxylicivirga taeanensis]|uniref:RluA family pseudouridine synthase n=1 Tax=Carboxylicivirga taeanensis TaxID=1416875 RepID=UPI003F6DCFF7